MRIPRREAQFCKSQQAYDEYKCTHDRCKSAYQAWHNEARRGKMTVSKNEVLKAKSACQAAATTAHQVEPSGSRDGDFCRESSDENQLCENGIKSAIQNVMKIPRRHSNFCKSQQAHDDCKCARDLCKSSYEAQHSDARRDKMTVAKTRS